MILNFVIYLLITKVYCETSVQLFKDDFTGNKSDLYNNWYIGVYNEGDQKYFTNKTLYTRDSCLYMNVMETKYKTDNNKNIYFMNHLSSRMNFTYGLFEIRANLENITAFAAIELQPFRSTTKYKNGTNLYEGTIALFHQFQSHPGLGIWYGNKVHYFDFTESLKSLIKTGFHLFTVEWSDREIIWRIDGAFVYRFPFSKRLLISETLGFYPEIGQPFDEPFFLQIYSSIPNYVTKLDSQFSNSSLVIDYIKVSKISHQYIEENSIKRDYLLIHIFGAIALITIIIIIILIIILKIRSKRRKKMKNDKELPNNLYDTVDYEYINTTTTGQSHSYLAIYSNPETEYDDTQEINFYCNQR